MCGYEFSIKSLTPLESTPEEEELDKLNKPLSPLMCSLLGIVYEIVPKSSHYLIAAGTRSAQSCPQP